MAQVFKEEEEAIKVDLHEGCGRTKLFWLMALADSKTMKAMVEFREHTGKKKIHCGDTRSSCWLATAFPFKVYMFFGGRE